MTLPKDPVMLLSTVNMLLRDKYKSLADLCEDYDIDIDSVTESLSKIGYSYDEAHNCFK